MAGSSNWEYVSLDNGLTVSLAEPHRSLTAGQYAAFYQGEVCLGGAKIEQVGPSLYTMNHNNCRTNILEKVKAASVLPTQTSTRRQRWKEIKRLRHLRKFGSDGSLNKPHQRPGDSS